MNSIKSSELDKVPEFFPGPYKKAVVRLMELLNAQKKNMEVYAFISDRREKN